MFKPLFYLQTRTFHSNVINYQNMEKLNKLRNLMKDPKYDVQAYIIHSEDAHQSEYTPHCDKRREFISSFTGSAGTAVVTMNEAALWTDGRYYSQANKQLDSNWKLMKAGLPETPTIANWLKDVLPENGRVGLDPRLVSKANMTSLSNTLVAKKQVVVPLWDNLVDLIWESKPPKTCCKVFVHPIKYSGKSHQEKIQDVRQQLNREKVHGVVISALDEIAWLYNLRGSDVQYNPVFIAYAMVTEDSAKLYIDNSQVIEEIRSHLGKEVEILPYDQIFNDLRTLSASQKTIWLDPFKCNAALFNCLDPSLVFEKVSPITLPKALKNETELNGLRECHKRDAAALINFFAWLEERLNSGDDTLTEVSVADKLEQFRAEQRDFVSLSFATISGSGPNGAIIHYKPEPETCAKVVKDQLYLCDSGGQYKDGTTDVTRTLHFGTPTDHQRKCYTKVLQGVINLNSAVFPQGTTGRELDILARLNLWKSGLDYRHGTGHGVGAFLNVHEGPHGITFRDSPHQVPLAPGMTTSNEPGYYEDGAFGIRIENVEIIVEINTEHNFGDRRYYGFETITLVPMQAKMIDTSLLSPKEIEWINKYHQQCWEKISPLLSGKSLEWLKKETQPIH